MKDDQNLTLNQPNIITQARYSFTEYEMRVLLYVIKNIQDKLNRNDVEFNRSLFSEFDYKIQFHLAEMMASEGEKNHTRVRKALKDLRDKSFEVEDEKHWFNVGFINYGRYIKDIKKWELQVSFLLMPYLVSMAKGYTRFQLNTILRLNTHSQRLFMMFSQFNETGIFRISAYDLRFKLGLEDKYEEYGGFKKRVITTAEKEIKELFNEGHSDIWFKLDSDSKKRGAEDFERMLTFKIFYSQRKTVQIEQAKAETLRYCTQILQSLFPESSAYANSLLGYLVEKKRLKNFSDRLERIEDQAQKEAKSLISFAPLVRHVAKIDYGFVGT